MAKAKKQATEVAKDKSEVKREEVMQQPGWSNTPPDSPQAVPVKKSPLVKEKIQE